MKNIVEKNYGEVTVVENSDYKWGVIDTNGNVIVPFGKYGWIDGFDNGQARVRTNKNPGFSENLIGIIDDNDVISGTENIKAYLEKDKKENPDKYAKWGKIMVRKCYHANMMRYGVFMAKTVILRKLSKMASQEKFISTILIHRYLNEA